MRTKGYKPADPEAIQMAREAVKAEYKLDTLPPAHHPRIIRHLERMSKAELTRYHDRMMRPERP